jgi:hypothetical protein
MVEIQMRGFSGVLADYLAVELLFGFYLQDIVYFLSLSSFLKYKSPSGVIYAGLRARSQKYDAGSVD